MIGPVETFSVVDRKKKQSIAGRERESGGGKVVKRSVGGYCLQDEMRRVEKEVGFA